MEIHALHIHLSKITDCCRCLLCLISGLDVLRLGSKEDKIRDPSWCSTVANAKDELIIRGLRFTPRSQLSIRWLGMDFATLVDVRDGDCIFFLLVEKGLRFDGREHIRWNCAQHSRRFERPPVLVSQCCHTSLLIISSPHWVGLALYPSYLGESRYHTQNCTSSSSSAAAKDDIAASLLA